VSEPPIEAAGAVVWREHAGEVQVLVIHRDRYGDWSLPKGKLDAGEHEVTAAVREVHEETGVAVRLGPLLTRLEYHPQRTPRVSKRVAYWCARPLDGTGVAADAYQPNHEVDAVRWIGLSEVGATLTYPRDAAVVGRFRTLVRTRAHLGAPLVVLRHGAATPRKAWDGPDRTRPLTDDGRAQAERVAALLGAYAVHRVLTSDAERCIATVRPYAAVAGVVVDENAQWSEDGAERAGVHAGVQSLLVDTAPTVLCTHRPVLPWVLEELGRPGHRLAPGEAMVTHRREGAVVGTESVTP